MQYTGKQRDAESGFMHLRARMYDPSIGRSCNSIPSANPVEATQAGIVTRMWPITLLRELITPGFVKDPGGAGIRYCIDRFIPTETARLLFCFVGDHRDRWFGANTFRIRQRIYQTADG